MMSSKLTKAVTLFGHAISSHGLLRSLYEHLVLPQEAAVQQAFLTLRSSTHFIVKTVRDDSFEV